jgi:hypothetical protein
MQPAWEIDGRAKIRIKQSSEEPEQTKTVDVISRKWYKMGVLGYDMKKDD